MVTDEAKPKPKARHPHRKWIWGIPLLSYLLFVYWYTSFTGPLSQQEIEVYLGALQNREVPSADISRLREFLSKDTGDRILIANTNKENAS